MTEAPCLHYIMRGKVSLFLIEMHSKIESSIMEESADEVFFCDQV
jgi:hypothetical protein